MTSKPKIIGYIILDQRGPMGDTGNDDYHWRYQTCGGYSKTPVAMYATVKEAQHAKRLVKRQYYAHADSLQVDGLKGLADRWERWADALRIRRVAVVEA